MKKPSLSPLFWLLVACFILICVGLWIDEKFHPNPSTCNPNWAHVEIHGGPEIIIGVPEPAEPEMV